MTSLGSLELSWGETVSERLPKHTCSYTETTQTHWMVLPFTDDDMSLLKAFLTDWKYVAPSALLCCLSLCWERGVATCSPAACLQVMQVKLPYICSSPPACRKGPVPYSTHPHTFKLHQWYFVKWPSLLLYWFYLRFVCRIWSCLQCNANANSHPSPDGVRISLHPLAA